MANPMPGPSGEPSRPSSLDTDQEVIEEDLHHVVFPHGLVEENFTLKKAVSSCTGQGTGRCSDLFYLGFAFHGSELVFFP
jgi:hypothetical protein